MPLQKLNSPGVPLVQSHVYTRDVVYEHRPQGWGVLAGLATDVRPGAHHRGARRARLVLGVLERCRGGRAWPVRVQGSVSMRVQQGRVGSLRVRVHVRVRECACACGRVAVHAYDSKSSLKVVGIDLDDVRLRWFPRCQVAQELVVLLLLCRNS